MKQFIFFILFLSLNSFSEELQNCPGKSLRISDYQEVPASWTDCVGTVKFRGKEHGGKKYVGEWKDALPHGRGTYTWRSGSKYVGQVEKDLFKGEGDITYSSGSSYSGEWKDDSKHGQGTYKFSNGDIYVGEWKDDKYHGQGTYTFSNGEIYVGEWKDDLKHGQGTYTYSNGDTYVGEWKDGSKHGQGTLSYKATSGITYTGEWKDDKYHGKGVYEDWNGTTFIVEASNGEFIKKVSVEDDAWLKKHYYTRTVKTPRVLAHTADGNIFFDIGDDTFRGLKVRVECYDAFDTKTVSGAYNLTPKIVVKDMRGMLDADTGSDATYGGKLIGGPLFSTYYAVRLEELAASPATDYCRMTTLDFRQ